MTCSPTAVAKLRFGLSELQAGDGLLDRIYRRPSCSMRRQARKSFHPVLSVRSTEANSAACASSAPVLSRSAPPLGTPLDVR